LQASGDRVRVAVVPAVAHDLFIAGKCTVIVFLALA
jgi:hypothetical protein